MVPVGVHGGMLSKSRMVVHGSVAVGFLKCFLVDGFDV